MSGKVLFMSLMMILVIVNAYDNKLAKKMAYFSGAAFSTEAEINSWTCKYCSYSKLQSVKFIFYLRPKSLVMSS